MGPGAYATAQTLPNCPDSKVVIAIDKSRSIDETEMNAQKSLLTTVVNKLDIDDGKISLDLMKTHHQMHLRHPSVI